MSPFSKCMIDLGTGYPTTTVSLWGHEKDRRSCRKLLRTAPGKHGMRRSQEIRRYVWVLAVSGRQIRAGARREREAGSTGAAKERCHPGFPQRCRQHGVAQEAWWCQVQIGGWHWGLGTSRRLSSLSPFCPVY